MPRRGRAVAAPHPSPAPLPPSPLPSPPPHPPRPPPYPPPFAVGDYFEQAGIERNYAAVRLFTIATNNAVLCELEVQGEFDGACPAGFPAYQTPLQSSAASLVTHSCARACWHVEHKHAAAPVTWSIGRSQHSTSAGSGCKAFFLDQDDVGVHCVAKVVETQDTGTLLTMDGVVVSYRDPTRAPSPPPPTPVGELTGALVEYTGTLATQRTRACCRVAPGCVSAQRQRAVHNRGHCNTHPVPASAVAHAVATGTGAAAVVAPPTPPPSAPRAPSAGAAAPPPPTPPTTKASAPASARRAERRRVSPTLGMGSSPRSDRARDRQHVRAEWRSMGVNEPSCASMPISADERRSVPFRPGTYHMSAKVWLTQDVVFGGGDGVYHTRFWKRVDGETIGFGVHKLAVDHSTAPRGEWVDVSGTFEMSEEDAPYITDLAVYVGWSFGLTAGSVRDQLSLSVAPGLRVFPWGEGVLRAGSFPARTHTEAQKPRSIRSAT